MHGCFQNFFHATDKRQKWFLEAEEWFNQKEGIDILLQ
jgi:hypothetical protein